jgi:hypothetical protein
MRLSSLSLVLLILVKSATDAGEPVWLAVEDLVVDQVEPAISAKGQPSRKLGLAVRGIYPLGRQLASLRADGIAEDEFQIIDFELQRQVIAADAPDGLSAAWEDVPIDTLREVVAASDGIALDFVDAAQRDTTILAPLPLLTEGAWGSAVIHPKLERRAGQYLFRFLDFGVERGRYYRYRVKLEVKNPYFRQQTTDPFLAVGATRVTPWSQPSTAILIESKVKGK